MTDNRMLAHEGRRITCSYCAMVRSRKPQGCCDGSTRVPFDSRAIRVRPLVRLAGAPKKRERPAPSPVVSKPNRASAAPPVQPVAKPPARPRSTGLFSWFRAA